MRLLCLDSSTAALTVALVEDGLTLAAVDLEVGVRHGELLAPALRDVLATAPGRPGAVAVGLGPGPFTSLRVGIATAAALADASGVPAYGACSLDLLAAPDVLVAQDARRKEVYWARYDAVGARVEGPAVESRESLAARLPAQATVLGAGAELLGLAAPTGELVWPKAERLWALVLPAIEGGRPVAPLTPLYLRRPDAKEAVRRDTTPAASLP